MKTPEKQLSKNTTIYYILYSTIFILCRFSVPSPRNVVPNGKKSTPRSHSKLACNDRSHLLRKLRCTQRCNLL